MPDDTSPPPPPPPSETGNALVPPPRQASTALAAQAFFPPSRARADALLRDSQMARSAEKLLRNLLDAMDVLGDTVAEGLGLRGRPADRSGPDTPPPPA